MKHIILIVGLLLSVNLFSQNKGTSTTSFTVNGNCGECKERIENAADIKGVKISSWDKTTKMLSVTYNPEKVTPEQIKQAVAKAGHDVGDFKAPDAAYKKLPDCCKYRDKACEKK